MNNKATARENILSNLRISSVVPDITSRKNPVMEYKRWSLHEKVKQLKQKMEAVHTEVLPCSKSSWGRMFRAVVKEKNIEKILYGTNTDLAPKLREMYQQTPEEIPELVYYENPIEDLFILLLLNVVNSNLKLILKESLFYLCCLIRNQKIFLFLKCQDWHH